jgi:tRNA dimethylallyltransferase
VRETQRAVTAAIADIEARGNHALLVGGTGLYVRAVVDQLAVPARDNALRAKLDEQLDTATAYARVQALDPAAAQRIEPNNRRRILRALEVLTATGNAFSDAGPGLGVYGPPAIDVALIGVWLPRAVLAARIEARFAAMREQGLLDEVRGLPSDISRTARQAIGYKEVFAHLDGEIADADEAFDLAVRRTRKFARRQRMWFRRDPRIRWIGTTGNPGALTPVVLALWGDRVATSSRATTPKTTSRAS